MSFDQSKLDKSFNQTRDIFDKYIYKTNDSIADVQVVGYFDRARFDVDFVGGLLEATCSDGYLLGMIQSNKALIKILDSNLNIASMPIAPDGSVSLAEGDQWVNAITASSANIFNWSEDTTATAPDINTVKLDNADESLATNIYINKNTLSGGSIEAIVDEVVVGDLIRMLQYGAPGNYITAKVSAPIIDNGSWFTVPISVEQNGGGFVAGVEMVLEFWATGFRLFYKYEEDETENTTSSTSFQTKLQLTTPTIEAGKYLLSWAFSLTATDNNRQQEVQINIDTLPLVACDSFNRFADAYTCYSSFKEVSLTDGVHQIDLDYRAVTGVAKIKGVRLKLDKLF